MAEDDLNNQDNITTKNQSEAVTATNLQGNLPIQPKI
jgi:hypothetical protein